MQPRSQSRLIGRVVPGIVLGIIVLAISPARSLLAQTDVTGSEYVGSETCKDCHAEIYANFATTPHWKTTLDTRRGPRWQGCESCHGAGREHVQSGGDPAKIFSFKNVSPAKIVERCLDCHQYGEEHGNFLRSAHNSNNVSCLECHSPHHFKEEQFLLRVSHPQLCYRCHLEVRPEFARPV